MKKQFKCNIMKEQLVLDAFVLDGEAERDPNGSYRLDSQPGWEAYFASTGKRLPTICEYITIIKQLDERQNPALHSLLQDLREYFLCTGTKIDYGKSNLPQGEGYLDDLIKDSAWRKPLEDEVLQYNPKEAAGIIQRASGKRPYIWTPDAARRISTPGRVVWLLINTDRFILNCGINPIYDSGRARGARDGVSVSEQDASIDITPQNKISELLPATESFDKPKVIHDPKSLEWARRLLDGTANGTIIDY